MSDIEDFLDRVCPWPASDEDAGWVNLHWIDKTKPIHFGAPGKPFRSRGDFVWMVNFLLSKGGKLDLYFCLTRQAKTKIGKSGKPLAVRKAEHALAAKALWIDLDVKVDKPDKAYPTLQEAYRALLAFCEAVGIPFPNVIVESGGGIHAYFVFDKQLTIAEWRPLADALVGAIKAHGLKCDSGCTTDPARILRLPGTLNHKTDPPKGVKLRRLEPDIPYDDWPLHNCHPNTTGVVVDDAPPAPSGNLGALGSVATWEKPPAAVINLKMEGCGAVEHDDLQPLDIRKIIPECAFVRQAIDTGGKDYDQAQWRYTTLLATALDKGQRLAHGMASGHREYTPVSTEDLWARSKGETADNPRIAWVSCRAISATGFVGCAACKHFAVGKSPLNLATRGLSSHVPAAAGNLAVLGSVAGVSRVGGGTTAIITSPPDMYLPEFYVLNAVGNICRLEDIAKKGEESKIEPVEMFTRPLYAPWAQVGPRGLHFLTEAGKGTSTRKVFLDASDMMADNSRFRDMVAQYVTPNLPFARKYMENFYMNWLSEVERAKGAIEARGFGWMKVGDVPNSSFVYGGRQWHKDGSDDPAGYVEMALATVYEPTGKPEPWIEAAQKFVFDQKRPELECILATAFAAPLMAFTGQPGALLALNGLSAAGKSTTMRIAMAVWSHHKRTQEVLSSTTNSVIDKMGKLGNIPVYWDEIKSRRDQGMLQEVAMYLNQGVSKGRMIDGRNQQVRTDWNTILVSGSNLVLYDHITHDQKTTDAGLRRVFEYTVPKMPMHMAHIDIDIMVNNLLHNYGVIGLEYAKHLAISSSTLEDRCTAMNKRFTNRFTDRSEERCWTALLSTLMVGAELANEMVINETLVTAFDLDRMFEFLCETLIALRAKVKDEANDASLDINIEETLTNFLRDHIDQTIVTDTVPWGPGDARKKINLLANPPHDKRKITVQFVKSENILRLSYGAFKDWLVFKENHGRSAIMAGLAAKFGMHVAGATLGAGTSFKQGYERLMHIKIEPYSWLWLMMPGNVAPDPETLVETMEAAHDGTAG